MRNILSLFFFVSVLLILISARPETGYNYEPPASGSCCRLKSTVGGDAGAFSQTSARIVNGHNSATIGQSAAVLAPSSIASSISSHSSVGGSSSNHRSGINSFHSGLSGGLSSGGSFSSSSLFNGDGLGIGSSNLNSNSAAFHGGFNSNGGGGGSVQIQKHIYVHVPPEDPEETSHFARQTALLQRKKHYKIIFIKAPNAPSYPSAELLANAGQNDEKTLIYVLVKKPDEPSVAELQAIQNSQQPSKPEVYFIKYKTRHGADGNFDGSFNGISEYSSSNSGYSISSSNSHVLPTKVSVTETPSRAYGVP